MKALLHPAASVALLLALATAGTAQGQAPAQPPTQPPANGGMPKPPAKPNAPKPYDEVITKEARSDDGLFKVHRIDDKIFWEVPQDKLGKELLWVTTFAKTQTGWGYGGSTEIQDRVVRFTKRGDKLLLRATDYQLRSDDSGNIKQSLANSKLEAIIGAFDVRAYGPNQSAVIEVTNVFTADQLNEFSAGKALGGGKPDPNRTFVEKIKSFPRNIEVAVLATYPAAAAATFRFGRPTGPAKDSGLSEVTVEIHHSIVALPDQPMKPRLSDDRVGFFSTGYFDFGSGDQRVRERAYINRWRLEKKDPSAPLSEPVTPITYYVGREVPEKWRDAIKKGIEDWQPAFEAAGFKNAIVAKDAPTVEQDPDWDAEDARYSVVRWLPSTEENAYGPSIVDPRTGEILDADVKVFHNILSINMKWYFVQVAPNDPRAQKLPLPDDLMSDLIRYVVSHEIGHTLGFPHNMRASSSFTIAQLRDKAWTEKWGTEASIMDYGRFNYVSQPGDGVRLIPKLGPYDYFAAEWGYKPLPQAATPEAEKPFLDDIASRQIANPMLRFGNADPGEDPARQTEDLGSDPVAATELGFKNLKRVLSFLVTATSKPGEDYDLLKTMYAEVLDQRTTELMHVVAVVGGVNQNVFHYQRGGAVYTPVPAEQQRRAVRFLLDYCFTTPTEFLNPDILSRIEPGGTSDRILAQQGIVLSSLLSDRKLRRMAEQTASGSAGKYGIADLLDDLRKGIWRELDAPKVAIDGHRRGLQRLFIASLASRIAPETAPQSDIRPLSRGMLQDLDVALVAAQKRAADRTTLLHLQDCSILIRRALHPVK